VRTIATDLLPHVVRLATTRVSTLTPEGRARIATAYERPLRHLGVRLDVLFAERALIRGGLVLMWNQESHLEHLVLPQVIPRPFFSLYGNALARFPFYGAYVRATGHVHVDRNDESQWRLAIARAAQRVHDGECIVVSPEGTRSRDGRLLPMKRGAFLLAAASTRPIVCMTVIGGHERLPRGSAVVRAGTVRVVFAEPIANDGDACALADRVAATFERVKRDHALDRVV
jgi:1-acyl-sn-glycerol-3-phosphate acyltransferase